MDAHVAMIISEYLSLNASNIFLSMLNLTEHVIAPTHTSLMTASPSRQFEIIRCLDYPPYMILATNNIPAALEKVEKTLVVMNMPGKQFREIGDYTRIYPIGVARVINICYAAFNKYIKSLLPTMDMRDIDHIMRCGNDSITTKYFSGPIPEWSLNQHVINPTIATAVETIKKVRCTRDMYHIRRVYNTSGDHVITYSYATQGLHPIQWRLACRFHEMCDTDDELRTIMNAAFDSTDEIEKFLDHEASLFVDRERLRRVCL